MLAAAPSLAMPGLNAVNVSRNEAELYGELLAQRLRSGGTTVLTARDLGVVLGVERQKQLLGCEESSCVAELAGALGTDGVIIGDVGKLGSALAQHSAKVANADAMPEALAVAARALLGQLAVSMQRPELGAGAITDIFAINPDDVWFAQFRDQVVHFSGGTYSAVTLSPAPTSPSGVRGDSEGIVVFGTENSNGVVTRFLRRGH